MALSVLFRTAGRRDNVNRLDAFGSHNCGRLPESVHIHGPNKTYEGEIVHTAQSSDCMSGTGGNLSTEIGAHKTTMGFEEAAVHTR